MRRATHSTAKLRTATIAQLTQDIADLTSALKQLADTMAKESSERVRISKSARILKCCVVFGQVLAEMLVFLLHLRMICLNAWLPSEHEGMLFTKDR